MLTIFWEGFWSQLIYGAVTGTGGHSLDDSPYPVQCGGLAAPRLGHRSGVWSSSAGALSCAARCLDHRVCHQTDDTLPFH